MPHVSLLSKLSFIHDSLPSPPGSAGAGGMKAMVSSHGVNAGSSSTGKDFTCSVPAPLWGSSHDRQFSTNFSYMGPSHRLPVFMNCSSTLTFHGEHHGEARIPRQPMQESHAGAGEFLLEGCGPVGSPRWSRLQADPVAL